MFIRAFFPIAALAAVVVAAPSALRARQDSECTTGPVNCCQSTKTATSDDASSIQSLLGAVVNVGDVLGINCSPIVGDNGCTQEPVCCNNNTFNGLINIGCSPITLGL